MIVHDTFGARYSLRHALAQGSISTLYRLDGHASRVAKIFEQPNEADEAKLRWMIAHPPAPRVALFAWPQTLLYGPRGTFVGYTMPAAPATHSLADVGQGVGGLRLHLQQRYRMGQKLAAAVDALHAAGYVAGNLHAANVLLPAPDGVALIDCDSFQVEVVEFVSSQWHAPRVAEAQFQPPERHAATAAALFSTEEDRFGLAVLLFFLLVGHHPFQAGENTGGQTPTPAEAIARGRFPYEARSRGLLLPPAEGEERYRALPFYVKSLIQRTFIEGHHLPAQRPQPVEWQVALEEAERMLKQCPIGHRYDPQLAHCPICPPPIPGKRVRPPHTLLPGKPLVVTTPPVPPAPVVGPRGLAQTLRIPPAPGQHLRWLPVSSQTFQLLWAIVGPMVVGTALCALPSLCFWLLGLVG